MRSEKEIKEKIRYVESYQAEAKRHMDKESHHKWDVVINYLKWVLHESEEKSQ